MGAWGMESCSNDTTFDALSFGCKDLSDISQEEVIPVCRATFSNAVKERIGLEDWHKLGVVIWLLRQGRTVPSTYLRRAKKIAEAAAKDEKRLACWRDPDVRKAHILQELAEVERVLAGARPKKQHVPGLFERMSEKLGNITTP